MAPGPLKLSPARPALMSLCPGVVHMEHAPAVHLMDGAAEVTKGHAAVNLLDWVAGRGCGCAPRCDAVRSAAPRSPGHGDVNLLDGWAAAAKATAVPCKLDVPRLNAPLPDRAEEAAEASAIIFSASRRDVHLLLPSAS